MERVVYLLGAGFSAPLGLPVIRNFLVKAKDLYFSDKDRFEHFARVLKEINEMHRCKTYYNVNLLNIEEILSVLEMEDQVTGGDRSKEFAEFIKDVVENYTPEMEQPAFGSDRYGYHKPADQYPVHMFGKRSNLFSAYGLFFANLLNLQLRVSPQTHPRRNPMGIHAALNS